MINFFHLISRIRFINPEANKIAILDSDDYWIRTLILKDLAATTLSVYPQDYRIYLTPTLVVCTLMRLRFINGIKIRRGSYLKSLLREIYVQYILACLDRIKAKVVLSTIDNSPFFQNLSRIDNKRIYFAIQNGTRTLACVRDSLPPSPHPFSKISMSNFYCFGQRDIDLFSRHGHKVDNYSPVGSLVGGYYKTVISVQNMAPQFDICLISQWHEHFFKEITGDDFPSQVSKRVGAGIKAQILFVQRLLEETNLNLVVCPRNDHDEAEVSFYKDAFGMRVKIANSDRKNFSTYRIIDQSRLVIALNSTTLAEVFSWGKKVLWCNILEDEHYEMVEAGISYFCGNDYNAFRERILDILKMPQDNYEKLTRKGASFINNYDTANPAHEVIRCSVIKALSDSH